jgi:hypothetical protein
VQITFGRKSSEAEEGLKIEAMEENLGLGSQHRRESPATVTLLMMKWWKNPAFGRQRHVDGNL